MHPSHVFIGRLTRDYILYPLGGPVLDSAGGAPLHAAGGSAVWADSKPGLVARVGADYPRQWLKNFVARGYDVKGIRALPDELDQRNFLSYSESFEVSRANPVAQFSRSGFPFPKTLLGYQPRTETRPVLAQPERLSPAVSDIPAEYLEAVAFHLCPMELSAHLQFAETLRGVVRCLAIDPAAGSMSPLALKELRGLLNGVTAFLPSLEEISALFWGKTHDPWEMAAAIGEFGCEYVVIKCGPHGQLLYDAISKRRWEIPAYPARLVDPTGAGDAFCGGFLAGYQKNYDPLEGVLHGNISASLAIESRGPFAVFDSTPGLADARLNALREMVREI